MTNEHADVLQIEDHGGVRVLRLTWATLNRDVAGINLDLHGLDAIADRHGEITKGFLSSPSATIAGGTTEVMKNILGEHNLGLPREPR